MYEELRPLHSKQLELLKELKRVCEENNLTYYLAYGTLLGAVRHKGFIPWDDDVDTVMPYDDIMKLQSIWKEKMKSGLFFQSPETDSDYPCSIYKLRLDNTTFIPKNLSDRDIHHGIDLDIYPMFNLPNNIFWRKIQYVCALVYMLLLCGEPPKSKRNKGLLTQICSRLILFLLRGRVREKVKNFCHRVMGRFEKQDTKCKVLLCNGPVSCKLYLNKEFFEKSLMLKFEDDLFAVPVGYDMWLKKAYGDYMKMPPVEEINTKLDGFAKIDTENSYLKYKGKYYCR